MLPPVAEVTVVVLMVLQQVVDGPQPGGTGRRPGRPAATCQAVAAGSTPVAPGSAPAVGVDLFTGGLLVGGQERQERQQSYHTHNVWF